jgi:protoporphyrin/coproporphyrin ferrochelatase
MREAGAADVPWQLVYQSRSGPPSMPWLEPDINDAIAELSAAGRKAVVIVPLGFVSDHMEVLWDLDNEALETAEQHGLIAVRVPTPGIHPAYVAGLVDLVLERVEGTPVESRPAVTELGPWYDVCRPGCCENVRLGFRPALAGIAP